MSDLPTSEDKVNDEVPEATSNKEDGSDVVEPDPDVEDQEVCFLWHDSDRAHFILIIHIGEL